MSKIKNNKIKEILSFILITIGAAISSFALENFLIPNTILDGGITGVSIIINKLTNIPLGLLIILINIPFIYIGYKHLGKNFLIKAIYSMTTYSIFISIFETLPKVTNQIILATAYGGMLLGIGCGLVIKFGGCLDGTESVSIVISKNTSLSVGQIVLIFNLIIYLVVGIIFGFDRAMYSLLTYFITFKVIDFVSEGLEQGKAALIITDNGHNISKEIYKKLGRTATLIEGKGLLSGKKDVLYCVITRLEVSELRRIANEIDESVFITITDLSEIMGNHIKSTKKINKLKQK
ncbi:MAG: YitT family protein [Bacilli bacterium]|nr:YitT family protein [Bacilli bacterium]